MAYATWYLTFGRSRIVAMPSDVSAVPEYVQVGLSNALDQIVQWPNLGLAVALASAVLLVVGRLGIQSPLVRPIAMAVGSIVLFSINGLGRAAFGTDQAKASRYVYIAAVLLLPLVLLALQTLMTSSRGGWVLGWSLLGWAIVGNIGAYFDQRDSRDDAARGHPAEDRGRGPVRISSMGGRVDAARARLRPGPDDAGPAATGAQR